MKSKLRKIVTSIVIGSMFVIFTSGVSAKAEDKSENNVLKYQLKATHSAIFKGGNIKTINSNNELSADTQDVSLVYADGKLNLELNMNSASQSGTANLSVVLYPSQVKMFKDKALIGKVETINAPYELLSLRIENDSTSYSLMRPNLYMKGHIVLTVGILNKSTSDIYYLQQIVDNLNFNQMLNDAKNTYIADKVSEQNLINLEANYFQLKSQNSTKSLLKDTAKSVKIRNRQY